MKSKVVLHICCAIIVLVASIDTYWLSKNSDIIIQVEQNPLGQYLIELDTRIQGGVVGDSQSAILEKGLPGQKYQKKLEEMSEEELKAYEEYLLTTQQLKK